MFRTVFAIACIAAPGAAFAHVGHVGQLAGHDHWIAAAALGLAAAAWAAAKLKERAEEPEAEAPADEAEPAGAES